MTRASISTRANPSEPLPSEFHEHDYALMTVGEFMLQRNPDEKFHQSSTWSSDIDSLNRDWLSHLGQSVDGQRRRVIVYGDTERPTENLVFRDRETREVVAVLRDGVLYRTRFRTVPRWYESAGHGREVRNIGIEREQSYFATACRRIEEAYRQPRLFEEPKPKAEQLTLLGDA